MIKNKKIWKYYREYQLSNIFAMIRNNRLDPKICTDDFNNNLVVITGATSGIGYLTARKYAAHGANLICINRNKEKSEDLQKEIESEFGDVLFSMINYARFINVDPEMALERTNKKFIKRFQYLEVESKKDGKEMSDMTLEEMDEYWNAAKKL